MMLFNPYYKVQSLHHCSQYYSICNQINDHLETCTRISFSGKVYLPFSQVNLNEIVAIFFWVVFQTIVNLYPFTNCHFIETKSVKGSCTLYRSELQTQMDLCLASQICYFIWLEAYVLRSTSTIEFSLVVLISVWRLFLFWAKARAKSKKTMSIWVFLIILILNNLLGIKLKLLVYLTILIYNQT